MSDLLTPIDAPPVDWATLPTMYELPSEREEDGGLPDEFHLWQAELCSAAFRPPTVSADEIFVASDLNLYYDATHTGWYKRPDWFAAIGVSRLYDDRDLRLSYVLWQEGVRPIVAIEFLSPSTKDEDLGTRLPKGPQPTKWQVYEQIVRIPYYVVFDRYTDELRVFELVGETYVRQPTVDDRAWFEAIGLGIGLWRGVYKGLERVWLRWYDASGAWVQLEVEVERDRANAAQQLANAEQQRANAEQQRANAEQQRADRLAERLRSLGINPDEIEP